MDRLVLFLCGHNAARSQMAEAFFNSYCEGVTAVSAGTRPAEGIHPLARKVMAEKGFSMKGQLPKPLTSEIIERAELIILMGCFEACPLTPPEKTRDWGLDEPVDEASFRIVRDKIEQKVRALIGSLGCQ